MKLIWTVIVIAYIGVIALVWNETGECDLCYHVHPCAPCVQFQGVGK